MYQVHDMMLVNGADVPVAVGSSAWFSWLSEVRPPSFSLRQEGLTCTFRFERRGEAWFWYAYHKQQGKLRKVYAGPSSALTHKHLVAVLAKVTGEVQTKQSQVENKRETDPVPREQSLRLLLLGTPALYAADQPLPLNAKTFALLAYLALVEIPPTRDQLFALLWPESSQEAARKNLQNLLWQLRSLLANQKDLVQVLPNGRLTLDSSIWIDARAFLLLAKQEAVHDQQPATILSLYRGPLLDGLTFADAASLEHWMLNERERFIQACLRLLTANIETLRSNGAWMEMLEMTQHALAIDPLQEQLHRFAMLAYARLGQRVEALRQYEQVRTLLDSELGIAPLPETEALHQAIERGSVVALPSARRHASSLQESSAISLPFVGRVHELQTLSDTLKKMLEQQQARVVTLAGGLGIGKSRLWREWSSLLPPDYTIIECRCLESTQTIPFAPLTRLVTTLFMRPHAPHLEPLWLAELARLVPELRVQYPNLPSSVSLPSDQERGRLFAACLHALQAVGKPPFIFFMDDVQWADQATFDWLAYCLESIKHLPLLLIVAYRPQDAPETLISLLAAWERIGVVEQIEVTPLSREEATTVIDQKTSSLQGMAELYEQSAGNPYYLSELLQAEGESVPTSLRTLIQTRLNRLPPATRQIIQAAAILDPDIEVDLLRTTSGRSEDETLDALDSLLEASFLKEADTVALHQEELLEQALLYMFVHPFTATVLREGLSSARLGVLHRRAAEALCNRYAGRLAPLAGRLFEHYAQAGQRQLAAHYAEMAGDYALTVASPAEAETFYQDALALEPSAARYLGLSQAQMRSGAIEAARAALLQALQRFASQKDAEGTLQAITYYFETYTLLSQFREAIEWVEQPEIQAYTSIVDPNVLNIMRSLVMVMKYRLLTPSQTLMEQERVNLSRLVRTTPDQSIALRVHLTLAIIFAEQGRWQEAIAAYRDFGHTAHALGDIFQEVLARNNVAYHTILLGDLETARKEIESVLALVKTYALSAAHFYVYNTYGELFLAQKNWSEAEKWLKRALAQVKQRKDTQAQVAEVYAHLGRVAWGRGDLEVAGRRLERASTMMHQAGTAFQQTQIDLWLTDLYSVLRKEDAARALLQQSEELLKDSGWLELQRRAMQITQKLL